MNLYAQDLIPPTDDITENVLLIHGFDPDTFFWTWSSALDADESENIEENTTLVPLPNYNPMVENAKFNTSSQLWEIITKENPLDILKVDTFRKLDVELARTLRRTNSPTAQSSGLYDLKYRESLQYIEDGSPADLSNYAFIEMGTKISGMNAVDYANLIISKHDEYANKLINIEKIRLQAKAEIGAVEYDGSVKAEILVSKITDIAEKAIDALFNL